MAFKSIIDIDINDEKFKAFLESFQRYSEEAEKAPEDWHRLAESISGAEKRVRGFGSSQNKAFSESGRHVNNASRALRGYSGSAGQANASVTAMSTSLGKTNRHQKSFIESVRKGSSGLKNFSVDAAASALGLDELAGPLAGVAIGITVIAAAAAKAALGLDKLTASKVKNAKAMGVTIAQQQAFNNYGSQLVSNPDQALAAVYRAKMNPQYAGSFMRAGMTHQQIESESAPEALFTYIKDIRAKLKAQPADVRGAMWHSLGADEVLGGTEGMGLVLNNSLKHINSYQARYKKHEAAYAISRAHGYNSIKTSQAASELRSKVTTNLENVAASKPATAASLGAIRGARAAVNSIDWAATSFASKIEQADGVLISDAEKADNAIGTTLHKAAGWAEKKAGLVSPIGKAYAKTYGWKDNNPGDVLPWKGYKGPQKHGLIEYPTMTKGIQANAKLLRGYPKKYGADTINSIAPIYTGDMYHPKALQHWKEAAEQGSGFKGNAKINMRNPADMVRLLKGAFFGENSIPGNALPVKQAVDTMPYYKGHPAASTHKQIHDAAKQGIMEGMGNVHIHVHTTGSGQVGKVAVAAHAAGR